MLKGLFLFHRFFRHWLQWYLRRTQWWQFCHKMTKFPCRCIDKKKHWGDISQGIYANKLWFGPQGVCGAVVSYTHKWNSFTDWRLLCALQTILWCLFWNMKTFLYFYHFLTLRWRSWSKPLLVDIWWRLQMETFSALLALCAGNSPVTGEFSHRGRWRGALMFSLICPWTNGWANNRDAGDLKRHRGHYDVIVTNKSMSVSCIVNTMALVDWWDKNQAHLQPWNLPSCAGIFRF